MCISRVSLLPICKVMIADGSRHSLVVAIDRIVFRATSNVVVPAHRQAHKVLLVSVTCSKWQT